MLTTKIVALAILVEALSFLYVAYWMSWMYLRLHATLYQAAIAGAPGWVEGLLLLGVSVCYWLSASARKWIRQLLVLAAIWYSFLLATTQNHVMSYWGVFQGDVIAITSASGIGFVVVGTLCVLDFLCEKRQSSRL